MARIKGSATPIEPDARADDLDRLGKLRLVGRRLVGAGVLLAEVGLERGPDAALQVEAELEPAF